MAFPAAALGALPRGGITAQTAFYTDGSDNLRIVSACAIANVTIILTGRYQRPDGTIGRFRYDHRPNSDRSVATQNFPLAAGFVLNVTAVATGADVPLGGCFVIAHIIAGLSGGTEILGTLLQGYVTTIQHRAWPGSPLESSTDGPGRLRQIDGAVPPPTSDASITVPTGARWELQSCIYALIPFIAGTNRSAMLYADGLGGVNFYAISNAIVDSPSFLYVVWSAGLSMPPFQTATNAHCAIPPACALVAGQSIKSHTFNMLPGDQVAAFNITVREWLEVSA